MLEHWRTSMMFDGAGGESDGRTRVSGAALRAMLFGHLPEASFPSGRLILRNVEIEGEVDLSYFCDAERGITLAPLKFENCRFRDAINISNSSILSLSLVKCDIARLIARNASVLGDLNLSGSRVGRGSGACIQADGIQVHGRVALHEFPDRTFESHGEVRFLNAKIGGNVEAPGAQMNGEGNAAISFDGAEIGGSLILATRGGRRFSAIGSVRLLGIKVKDTVSLAGAAIDGAGHYALTMQRSRIDGTIFLMGRGGTALHAKGALRLSNLTAGALMISQVEIEPGGNGELIDLQGSSIAQTLTIEKVSQPSGDRPVGVFNLNNAEVGVLLDDFRTAWPTKGNLLLDGFRYGDLAATSGARIDAMERLEWLDLQHLKPPTPDKFKPQPYEQLAAVLRRNGQAADADIIAMRKRDWAIECQTERGINAVLTRLMGLVSGHGYERHKALAWMIGWWVFGMLWIFVAQQTNAVAIMEAAGPTAIGAACVDYILPVYALELMVPIVDLGQTDACQMKVTGLAGELVIFWRAIYQIIGLVLFTVLGVTLAGLIRSD